MEGIFAYPDIVNFLCSHYLVPIDYIALRIAFPRFFIRHERRFPNSLEFFEKYNKLDKRFHVKYYGKDCVSMLFGESPVSITDLAETTCYIPCLNACVFVGCGLNITHLNSVIKKECTLTSAQLLDCFFYPFRNSNLDVETFRRIMNVKHSIQKLQKEGYEIKLNRKYDDADIVKTISKYEIWPIAMYWKRKLMEGKSVPDSCVYTSECYCAHEDIFRKNCKSRHNCECAHCMVFLEKLKQKLWVMLKDEWKEGVKTL